MKVSQAIFCFLFLWIVVRDLLVLNKVFLRSINCFCSLTVIGIFFQRTEARYREANTSFRQLFSVKKRGIIFVLRFCSSKPRSMRFVVRIALRCFSGHFRCWSEASISSWKQAIAAGNWDSNWAINDAAAFVPSSYVGASQMPVEMGSDCRLSIFGHLGKDIPLLMSQTALAKTLGEHSFNRLDEARSPIRGNKNRYGKSSFLHIPKEIQPAIIGFFVA